MLQRSIDRQAILERLRAKLSPEDFAALERGQEVANYLRPSMPAHPGEVIRPDQVRPVPVQSPIPGPVYSEQIKVHPLVVITANRNNLGGAARLYFLARSLDETGRGMVAVADLRSYLRGLGVTNRTRERWQRQAAELGLVRRVRVRKGGALVFALVALEKACVLLGADRLGRPAMIQAAALAADGWGAHVWQGYTATTEGRRISQKRKEKITGVPERTQRYYQANPDTPALCVNRNVRKLGGWYDPQAAQVLRESGMVIFEHKGSRRAYQRFADGRTVHPEIARTTKRGRGRKVQAYVNHANNPSSSMRRGSGSGMNVRLFCDDPDKLNRAKAVQDSLKIAAKLPKDRRPPEIFERVHTFAAVNRRQLNYYVGHEVVA